MVTQLCLLWARSIWTSTAPHPLFLPPQHPESAEKESHLINRIFSKKNVPLASNPLYCRLTSTLYQTSILTPFLGTKGEILIYFLNAVARERSFTTINGQHEGWYRAIKSIRLERNTEKHSIKFSGKVIQNSRHIQIIKHKCKLWKGYKQKISIMVGWQN